jgi:hypothetical protein
MDQANRFRHGVKPSRLRSLGDVAANDPDRYADEFLAARDEPAPDRPSQSSSAEIDAIAPSPLWRFPLGSRSRRRHLPPIQPA